MRVLAKKACVWQLRDDCREELVKSCFVRWLLTFIFLGEGNKKSFKLPLPSKDNALSVTGGGMKLLGNAGYIYVQLH